MSLLSAWLESGRRPEPIALEASASESDGGEGAVNNFGGDQHVLDRLDVLLACHEFVDQGLKRRGDKAYCPVCKSDVGSEARLLRQHCFRKQNKDARARFLSMADNEKIKCRHYKKLCKWKKKERDGASLREAVKRERAKIDQEAEDAITIRKNVKDEEIAKRVRVFEVLAGNGIPLSKLDSEDFLELIEGDGPRLAGRQGVLEVQPLVQKRQEEQIRSCLQGRAIGLFFDGSKSNYSIEGIVARFVSDQGVIRHILIGLSRVERSLDATELKGLALHHLEKAGVFMAQVMNATTDSAALNKSMGKMLNWEVRAFEEGDRFAKSFPLHHCFPHMISNAGATWRKELRGSSDILAGLKGLRVSEAAKDVFKALTGQVLPDGTENRWFYWVEFVGAVLDHWRILPKFAKEVTKAGYMPKKVAKMQVLTTEGSAEAVLKAGLEMTLVHLLGKPLAKTCYFLEGDSFLAPFTFERLDFLQDMLTRVDKEEEKTEHEYKLALLLFAQKHASSLYANVRQRLVEEVWKTRHALVAYWKERIWEGMSDDIQLFKGFSVLDPVQLAAMSDAEVVERLNYLRQREVFVQGPNPARVFLGVKGFTEEMQLKLILQLRTYRTAASQVRPVLESIKRKERPAKLWEWWWSMREAEGMKQWGLLAMIAVLHQPSSAAIERFFSVYKGMTTTQQCKEKDSTSLVRAQCRYNAGKFD